MWAGHNQGQVQLIVTTVPSTQYTGEETQSGAITPFGENGGAWSQSMKETKYMRHKRDDHRII